METIVYNISQVLGITIIHSLWQGLLVYFILRMIFACVPSLSSVKKHNLAVGAMAAVALWFGYTLYTQINAYNWISLQAVQASPLIPYLKLPVSGYSPSSFYHAVSGYLPLICAVYFIGLFINLAKLSWEWTKIRQVRRTLINAEQMQQFINKFSQKLDLSKHIQIKFSELINVPCVIGYLKPLIILPVSLSVHLSACEIESILLHELSHIKRNDYLVNIIQQFITIILFFNPFTQLINRIINRERENGCDDLVVEKTRRPLIYARALLKLEEARKHNLQLALAATGKNFHLLNRIERIMKTNKSIGGFRNLLIPVLLLAGGISCIAWFNPKMAEGRTAVKKAKPAVVHNSSATTIISGANCQVSPQNDGDVKLTPVTDTTGYKPLADTTKYQDTTIAKNTPDTIKESYSDDFDFGGPDSVRRLYPGREWRGRIDAMRKHFDSPEWRRQMADIRKQGEAIRRQFDNPQWKKQILAMQKQGEAMRKQGEEMQKRFSSAEWKSQMKAIQKQGEEMRKQFDSPQWKNQVLAMQRRGEDMRKQGEEMRKQFDSPQWKEQMDNIRKQGEEMKKHFDSPEWKEQMENIRKQGEEMKKHFDSPEWKEQMENIRKQGEEMRKEFNSPEWKNSVKGGDWMLSDSTNGVKIYHPVKKAKKKVKSHQE